MCKTNLLIRILISALLVVLTVPSSFAITENLKVTKNVSLTSGSCNIVEEYTLTSDISEKSDLNLVFFQIPKQNVLPESVNVNYPSMLDHGYDVYSNPSSFLAYVGSNSSIFELVNPLVVKISYIESNCITELVDTYKQITVIKNLPNVYDSDFNISIEPISFILNFDHDLGNNDDGYMSYFAYPFSPRMGVPQRYNTSIIYGNFRVLSKTPLSVNFISDEIDGGQFLDVPILIQMLPPPTLILDQVDILTNLTNLSRTAYFAKLGNQTMFYRRESINNIIIYTNSTFQGFKADNIPDSPARANLYDNELFPIAITSAPCHKFTDSYLMFPFQCIRISGQINISNYLSSAQDSTSVDMNYTFRYDLNDFDVRKSERCLTFTKLLFFKNGIPSNWTSCNKTQFAYTVDDIITFIFPRMYNYTDDFNSDTQQFNSSRLTLAVPRSGVTMNFEAELTNKLMDKGLFLIVLLCATLATFNFAIRKKQGLLGWVLFIVFVLISSGIKVVESKSFEHVINFVFIAPLLGIVLYFILVKIFPAKMKKIETFFAAF